MTEKAKSLLVYAALIGVLALSYAAVSYVKTYSRSIEPGAYRSFPVTGEGKVVAVPDVAEFTFSVITQGGKNLAKLQQENTEHANRAIGFIKSNGVEDKDIKTQGYSVEPRYQNVFCGEGNRVCQPPEIVGYTITQTVSVKVRDFAKIGDLLSGVVSAGANSVSQISFTIDDRTALENKAREEAMMKAREKAEAMARAGGFRLGKLISINEGWGGPVYYGRAEAFGVGGDAIKGVPAPTIEPGSQDIVVNVTMVFEIR